jgi:hypothetical protein
VELSFTKVLWRIIYGCADPDRKGNEGLALRATWGVGGLLCRRPSLSSPFLANTWLNGNLYGATDPGRKTQMAEQSAQVSFQLDNAQVPWEWQSETGVGVFELLTDPTEIEQAGVGPASAVQ